MEMFEKAARLKLRFDTPLGALSIEDLWDLPLTARGNRANLDDIAVALHRQLENKPGMSFVVKDRKSNETVQLKFDVAKHIIDVRVAEQEAEEAKQARKQQRDRILEILADKEDETLKTKSVDELRQLAEQLAA